MPDSVRCCARTSRKLGPDITDSRAIGHLMEDADELFAG